MNKQDRTGEIRSVTNTKKNKFFRKYSVLKKKQTHQFKRLNIYFK
jgi:hypothetical protein